MFLAGDGEMIQISGQMRVLTALGRAVLDPGRYLSIIAVEDWESLWLPGLLHPVGNVGAPK